MIGDKLKESYKSLIKECIDRGSFFKDKNNDCGLAIKVTEIYLIDCPNRYEFKCMAYRKQDNKLENKV